MGLEEDQKFAGLTDACSGGAMAQGATAGSGSGGGADDLGTSDSLGEAAQTESSRGSCRPGGFRLPWEGAQLPGRRCRGATEHTAQRRCEQHPE